MKFYCVKCKSGVEVPEEQCEVYVPEDPVKAEKMKKANRVGYRTKHSCGTMIYTFRTQKA